jgi:MFS superfamily sulfate permease-like transporter
VLAVVTSSTIANIAPPPPPLLAGAVAVETSGSFGIIIGVLVGVIIALVLALVVMHRRRHLNVGLHVPNGHEDEKVALARHKAESADDMVAPDEMAAPEPKPTGAPKAPEAPKLVLAVEEGFELQNKP